MAVEIGDRVILEETYDTLVGEIISIVGDTVTVQWEHGEFEDIPLEMIDEEVDIHEVVDYDENDILDDIGDMF